MTGRRRWYQGLGAVEATVRCGGRDHSVRWRGGRVALVDHDPGAERALVALGGPPVPCLDVLDACRQLREVGPFQLWAAEADAPTAGMAAVGAVRPPSRDHERRIDALRALPLAFRRRLALASLVAAGRRDVPEGAWEDPGLAAVVGSLVVPVVRAALVVAGGPREVAAALDVRWVPAAADVRPEATGEARPRGGWVRLRLAPSWAAVAWAHDLATHDGAVVLDVVPDGRGGRRLSLARWRPCGGGRWRLGPATAVLAGERG
jgi:hypothetical protein